MGLHAYCIAPAGHLPNGTGIEDAPLLAVAAGQCVAWASRHPAPPAANVQTVRRHDDVIRAAITELVTPVPLRFGQWTEDEAALAARIGDQAERWLALLQEFAGAIELGLRFTPLERHPLPAAAQPERAASGRAYMQQLAARAHERDRTTAEHAAIEARVQERLSGCVLRAASGVVPDDPASLWLAHLVRRASIQEYRELAAAVGDAVAGYRMSVTGPWPPYSFVS